MIRLTILETEYLIQVLEECAVEHFTDEGIANAIEILRECLDKPEDVESPDGETDIFY